MKYIGKKIIVGIIVLIVVLIGGFAAWMLVPASAGSMLRSTVVVEQKVWQEVCVDGKPLLYFDAAEGDTVLVGVTANRDSAMHRHLLAGCWLNGYTAIPLCRGRVVTVFKPAQQLPKVKDDSTIVRLCRASIAEQARRLHSQQTELKYYLRVHGVQDNGYQAIAGMASHIDMIYKDVQRAGRLLDSVASGHRHRFALRTAVSYTAVYSNDSGRVARAPLNVLSIGKKRQTITLQTTDATTPDGVSALHTLLWNCDKERDIRAVGYPGLGESGLESDTIQPVIVPGRRLSGARHDLPRVLVSDGAPVFTAKGQFMGIVAGGSIVKDW